MNNAFDTALVELVALAGAVALLVQLLHDVRCALPGGVMLKDEPNGGSGALVNDELLAGIGGETKRPAAVDSLALESALPHR